MQDYTNEQVLGRYQAVLGEDFGRDFRMLENSYSELRVYWRVFVSFYGVNQERVELLNSVSGLAAEVFSWALFDQCILRVSRLLDPAQSGRGGNRDNLTFQRLRLHIHDQDKLEDFSAIMNSAISAAEPVRDWRNRQIAHSDFDVANHRAQLMPLSGSGVKRAIDSSGGIIQWVHRTYFDSETTLDPIVSPDDELNFLRELYLGHEIARKDLLEFQEGLERGDESCRLIDREYPEWLSQGFDEFNN